jgi:hypothetical protein
MNKIDFKHKFETETGQGIYSGEGQIEINGTYNDAYVEWLEDKLNNTIGLGDIDGSLPTKDDIKKECDKQMSDWLQGNTTNERLAYKVAFRRSFEYVLRFIK